MGGGSLVIGGGGMALGSLALGLTTGGIGLLIGGSVLALIGSNKTDEAEKEIESAEETERQVDKFIHYYDELITYASHFKDALCGIKELYEEQLKRLDYVVNVLGKVHWSDFADGEKQLTKTTVFLVELLYKMCNTGLVQKEKNSDVFNSVNKFEVDSIVSEASIILDNAKGNK